MPNPSLNPEPGYRHLAHIPVERETDPMTIDGHLTEKRIVEFLERLRLECDEYHGGAPYRAAYQTEPNGTADKLGIDIVIEDCFGRKYPIQVKTHTQNAEDFARAFKDIQQTKRFQNFVSKNLFQFSQKDSDGNLIMPVYVGKKSDQPAQIFEKLKTLYPAIFQEDKRITKAMGPGMGNGKLV